MSRFIPLLAIPLVLYNLTAPLLVMTTPLIWVFSLEEILVTMALVIVGIELWRSAVPTPTAVRRQLANLTLFTVAVLEFALLPWCYSGTFFVLVTATLITLVDSCLVAFTTRGPNVMVSDR